VLFQLTLNNTVTLKSGLKVTQGHAMLRKSDLEVMARHLNKVEAVQHVYLTNIPVWFVLLGDI